MKEKLKRFFIKDDEKPEASEEDTPKETIAQEVAEKEEDKTDKPLSEYTVKELSVIKDKIGGDEVMAELLSEGFSVFAEERGGSLEEKYEAFARLKALMKPKEAKKDEAVSSEAQGRLHSGFSGGAYRDVSTGLTKRQMDMAKSAGMSFKEYEELLVSAPSGRKNRF